MLVASPLCVSCDALISIVLFRIHYMPNSVLSRRPDLCHLGGIRSAWKGEKDIIQTVT